MSALKKYVRGMMVYAPALQEARFRTELVARKALKRVHDRDWLAFEHLKIGSGVILDIGANRGQSIASFNIVKPNCSIDAFEPNPSLSARLSAYYAGDANVRIHSFALSDVHGEFDLYVPKYREWIFDGLASLNPEEASGWLNEKRVAGFDPKLQTLTTYKVKVLPLDTLGLKPSVMKLDTQGTEYAVLRGAVNTIAENHPIILVESPPVEITNLLAPMGYRPYSYIDGKFLADRVDAKNVFYLREEHFPS